METVVYRKIENTGETPGPLSRSDTEGGNVPTFPETSQETRPLAPDLFYPLVSAEEMVTWTHWLPTTLAFDITRGASPLEVFGTLTALGAPPAVLEEFHWSWQMGLFDAYDVRTPTRRDQRDPLLLGRLGTQHYRMALWGESLRPLEEMSALVQRSLALRACAATWRVRLVLGGAFLGFGCGTWLGSQPAVEGTWLGTGLVFALLGVFFTGLPLLMYTPENRQQDFLDRYRREERRKGSVRTDATALHGPE